MSNEDEHAPVEYRAIDWREHAAFYQHPDVMHDFRVAESMKRGYDPAAPQVPTRCGECAEMTTNDDPRYIDYHLHTRCFRERERRALGGTR
jgi:hypothetical protein